MLRVLNRCPPKVLCGGRRISSSPRTRARSAIACGSGRRTFWCSCWSDGLTGASSLIGSTFRAAIRVALVADSALDCGIAFARVDHHFLLLALLVFHVQRVAVRRYQFDFYFVKFAVAGAGGRGVRQAVLVAQKRGDGLENSRNFAVELREPKIATGHASERL